MPYDRTQDPNLTQSIEGMNTFGRIGSLIVPSDTVDLTGPYPKAIEVTVAGNLAIIPAGNADSAAAIAYTSVPVGFRPGFIVRRVMLTGTTASVVRIDG